MNPERSKFETPIQEITLNKFSEDGLIVDIGGGGEGLVSRIDGARVCAIDYRISEIREAQIHNPSSNWFVSDARCLCFRDETFDIATLWFSMGYLRTQKNKDLVLREAHRVLKSGGLLSIFASHITCLEDVFIIHLRFTLPDGTVSQTGYGVRGNQNQTLECVKRLLNQIGFRILSSEESDFWFQLKAMKE